MSAFAEAPAWRPLSTRWLSPLRAGWPRVATTMGVLLGVYGCWQLFRWPAGHRPLVGNVWFAAFALAQTVAAWLAARRCSRGSRLRSAWRLLALGAGAYLLGQIAWTIYELLGQLPYPSVADCFSLMFYPLTLAGLLRFTNPISGLGQRVRIGLDLAVVAIGSSAVVFYVVLGPTIVAGGSDALQTAASIAYPTGDVVLLVGLASVLVRGASPSSGRALQFMAAGLVFFVVADVLYGYTTLNSTYQGGDPIDTVYVVAMALFAIAASAQGVPSAETGAVGATDRRRASWAPFIAVAIGFGMLVYSQRHDPLIPNFTLVMVAVLLATLVAARQFLAQRDLLHTQGRLSHQSLHDALTGLPNRLLVIDRAEQMLARARRNDSTVAALYVDIDGFKHVNDSFGHAAGDEMLRAVSARLSEVVRESDTVGRLGGDEFVMLVDNVGLDAGPELIAERVCDVLAQPVQLVTAGRRALTVTASVGIALGQEGSAEELLRDADFALYEAKRAGKNRWAQFESRMQTAVQDRLALELDLKDALANQQLFLLYQPTFDLETESITGVEALIRWRHPTRGIVPPAKFIPLAEEDGTIVPIGRWVLRTACEQAIAWHRTGMDLGLSVNVSARQLDQPTFVAEVAAVLADTGLDPAKLTLEITETTLMRDADGAARRLAALKELGLRIAIDDFGTGYSSLAYLRQFSVDSLKIDRSFIAGIAASGESKALIHTLVQLGKALGLETVGEGIEARSQLRQLQREQCDSGQGFLFARPLEAQAIPQLFQPAVSLRG